MTKLSTNSDLRVTKVFYRCSLRNSTLKVNNYSEKQILGKKSYHLNLVPLHGMMLFQWFLYNLMWYTFLVLEVLHSNFYLIFSFSQLSICLLMSSGIAAAQKVKNLDLFFKWWAFSYISHFLYTTWLWLNFLHMTFGIYILNLVVNRKS